MSLQNSVMQINVFCLFSWLNVVFVHRIFSQVFDLLAIMVGTSAELEKRSKKLEKIWLQNQRMIKFPIKLRGFKQKSFSLQEPLGNMILPVGGWEVRLTTCSLAHSLSPPKPYSSSLIHKLLTFFFFN